MRTVCNVGGAFYRGNSLDLRNSSGFVAAHPGVDTAFDGPAMAAALSGALGVEVVACQPDEALFEPDGYCMVRCNVELVGGDAVVVGARLFGDPDAAEAFLSGALERPAADLDGRGHRPPVPVLAATVPTLAMAVSVFPVDGELPSLVRVTDPDETEALLDGALPSIPGPYRVAAAHYGRRRRCALRYEAGDAGARVVAYGKVANDGGGRDTRAITDALRAGAIDFDVPPVLADRPDLGLIVLGRIAGAPRVAQLLQARVRGAEPPSDAPSLEQTVATCGRVAAALHAIEVPLTRRRTLEGELAGLRTSIDVVGRYTAELAARVERALVSAESFAADTQPAADVTAHGDFSYTQLLFSRDRQGLVDFDGVCRAEPALDLGHFLAYLRFATVKAAGADAPRFAPLEAELEAMFLDAYRSADGPSARRADAVIDDRVRVYETVSLLQRAVHAWQKLKPERLDRILAVLDARQELTT
jgi:hypothetical protein